MGVWATWYAPCNAETPYMVKFYEHYKYNQNICFVSVSVDSNKEAWKKKLVKDYHPWLSLIVNDAFKSKMCTSFGITSISRFMLFDKSGHVIMANAPRPSDKAVYELIDRVFKN